MIFVSLPNAPSKTGIIAVLSFHMFVISIGRFLNTFEVLFINIRILSTSNINYLAGSIFEIFYDSGQFTLIFSVFEDWGIPQYSHAITGFDIILVGFVQATRRFNTINCTDTAMLILS